MYYRNIKLTIIAINVITCRLNMIKIDKDIRQQEGDFSDFYKTEKYV